MENSFCFSRIVGTDDTPVICIPLRHTHVDPPLEPPFSFFVPRHKQHDHAPLVPVKVVDKKQARTRQVHYLVSGRPEGNCFCHSLKRLSADLR